MLAILNVFYATKLCNFGVDRSKQTKRTPKTFINFIRLCVAIKKPEKKNKPRKKIEVFV